MDSDQLEDYTKKRLAGAAFSEIKAELRAEGYSESEVTQYIQEIDDEALFQIELNTRKKGTNPRFLVGWAIIIFSIICLILLLMIGVTGGIIIIALLGTLLSGIAMLAQSNKSNEVRSKKFKR